MFQANRKLILPVYTSNVSRIKTKVTQLQNYNWFSRCNFVQTLSMGLVNIDEEIYAWMSRVVVILVLFLSIITIIWHIFCVNRELKTKRTQWSYLLASTFMLQLIIMICLVTLLYATFFSFANNLSCKFAVYSSSIAYILSKWALYMVLSFRADVSFRGSAYEYSKYTLNIWRVFFGLAIILEISVLWLTASVDIIDDDIEKENSITIPCKIGTTDAASLIVVCVDCIASFVNSYMFINPLKKAAKAVESRKNIFDTHNNTSKIALNNLQANTCNTTSININNNNNNIMPDKDLQDSPTSVDAVAIVAFAFSNDDTNEMGSDSIRKQTSDVSTIDAFPNGTGAVTISRQHISTASVSVAGSTDSTQIIKSTSSLSSSSSVGTIKRSPSLQKKTQKFLDIIRKTTVLTVIAVTGTIVSLLLIYFVGITSVWYVLIRVYTCMYTSNYDYRLLFR